MSNVRGSAYLLAVITALAFGISLVWRPAPPPKYEGLANVRVPEKLAGYESRGDDAIEDNVRAALSAADLVSRTYLNNSGQPVQFTMIGGTDRSALHDPRSCLVGAGWRIEDDHTETLPDTGVKARVCRIVQDSTKNAYEVVYLYVVNKEIITEVTQIRFRMLLSALVGQKGTPAVFVRFMRPLQSGADADAASRAQFLDFTSQMWNTLEPGIVKEARAQNT
jgi:EpsI family protein